MIQEAVELAKEGDPFDFAQALVNAANFHKLLRERDRTRERAEEAIAIAAERGFAATWLIATLLRGWARGGSDGLQEVQQGLALAEAEERMRAFLPQWLGFAAEMNRDVGRTEDALDAVEAAIGIEEETGAQYSSGELQRLKGEILLQQGATGEAESCFRRSLEVTRAQQAKSLELRAATSLARLMRDQGRRDEARALLQPVYAWFSEGFDTPDLEDAKALLEDLAQSSSHNI